MKYVFLLATVFLMFSCNYEKYGTWQGGFIPEDIKVDLDVVRNEILSILENGDTNQLKSLFAEGVIKDAPSDLFSVLNKQKQIFSKNNTHLIDEFYANSNSTNSIELDRDLYQINIIGDKKSYLFLQESKLTAKVSFYTLAVLGYHDNKWKINYFNHGLSKINGENIQVLFKDALEYYEKDYLILAMLYGVAIKDLNNNMGEFWKYKLNHNPNSFIKNTNEEILNKYDFPIELKNVSSKPSIFDVSGTVSGGVLLPVIRYYSDLEITDSLIYDTEKNEIKEILPTVFEDFKEYKGGIVFQAIDSVSKYYRMDMALNN